MVWDLIIEVCALMLALAIADIAYRAAEKLFKE